MPLHFAIAKALCRSNVGQVRVLQSWLKKKEVQYLLSFSDSETCFSVYFSSVSLHAHRLNYSHCILNRLNRVSQLRSAWEGPEIKSISVTSPASLLNLLGIFTEPLSKVYIYCVFYPWKFEIQFYFLCSICLPEEMLSLSVIDILCHIFKFLWRCLVDLLSLKKFRIFLLIFHASQDNF